MSAEDRLKDSLIAAGHSPTPEGLTKASGMSVEAACEVFGLLRAMPRELLLLAETCAALRVRMYWLVTSRAIPQVTGTMTTADAEALGILMSLDSSGARKWLRTGKHLLKS